MGWSWTREPLFHFLLIGAALFAWFSLVWVGFSDVYVRLCAMGIWTDMRFF